MLSSRSKGLPPIPVTNEGNVAGVSSGIFWDVLKHMVAFRTWDVASVAVTALQHILLNMQGVTGQWELHASLI